MIRLNDILENILDTYWESVDNLTNPRQFHTYKNYLQNLNTISWNIQKIILEEIALNNVLAEYNNSQNGNLFYYKNNVRFFIKKRVFKEKLYDQFKVCPYCGKIPFTPTRETVISCHLDHFFKKEDYNSLMLDPYNLVPCCQTCNWPSGKWSRDFGNWLFFHPYLWRFKREGDNTFIFLELWSNCFDTTFEFNYDYIKNNIRSLVDNALNKSLSIDLNEHIKFFWLNSIYDSEDTANDYLNFNNLKDIILSRPNSERIDSLQQIFKNRAPITRDEILKYVNGKMKKDLVDRLKKDINGT